MVLMITAEGFRPIPLGMGFSLAGIGTVVTGTAVAGRVAVGDKLLLSPAGKAVRVRGLHAQNAAAETGIAGQRLALNLAGVVSLRLIKNKEGTAMVPAVELLTLLHGCDVALNPMLAGAAMAAATFRSHSHSLAAASAGWHAVVNESDG